MQIRGGFTIEFSEMRGPNKIFCPFIVQNGPNILFGRLISDNSIVKPPLVIPCIVYALPELPVHKHMTQKEEWCSVAKGSLRIFIDSKPPWSSSSTPIKDFGRKSGWKQGRVGLITKKYDVQTIEWLQHKQSRCLSYKVT